MGGATRTLVAHLLRNDPVTAQATYKAVRSRFWGLRRCFTDCCCLDLCIFPRGYLGRANGRLDRFHRCCWRSRIFPSGWLVIVGVIGALVAIAFTLWFFFFIVGRVAYVPQVMLVEGKGVIESVGRSISLARGNVRRLMAMTLFTTFATISALMILSIAIGFFGELSGVNPVQSGRMARMVRDRRQRTWTIKCDTAHAGLDAGPFPALR